MRNLQLTVQKPKIHDETKPILCIKIKIMRNYETRIACFDCIQILREDYIWRFPLPNIFVNALVLAYFTPCLCYIDVICTSNIIYNLTRSQVKFVLYNKYNHIAHKKYHCFTVIGSEWRVVTCMISYIIFNLQVFTWILEIETCNLHEHTFLSTLSW